MAIRVGINGFGRIGKCVLRVLLETEDIVPVLVNDPAPSTLMAGLLKYDSVHGTVPYAVELAGDTLSAKGRDIALFSSRNPEDVPWGEHGCDIVLECSGFFRDREGAGRFFQGGAKKVIISAPASNPDITIVVGVNHGSYDAAKHHIISNASCTTNCLAPVAKVLDESFGIEHGLMTTIHSYTNDQNILDRIHKDARRARAAAMNMVPTTTGAAKAVALVLPALEGRINGMAVRVPTPNVSLVDLVATVREEASVESLNAALTAAAEGPLKGILAVSFEPLVSSDYIGTAVSSTVDALSTAVTGGGKLIKLLSWYDNEWGFSNRMADLTRVVAG